MPALPLALTRQWFGSGWLGPSSLKLTYLDLRLSMPFVLCVEEILFVIITRRKIPLMKLSALQNLNQDEFSPYITFYFYFFYF